jgi:hypothetical protein
MLGIDIMHTARALIDSHGTKAAHEAAQRARTAEAAGKAEDARWWRLVEQAVSDVHTWERRWVKT